MFIITKKLDQSHLKVRKPRINMHRACAWVWRMGRLDREHIKFKSFAPVENFKSKGIRKGYSLEFRVVAGDEIRDRRCFTFILYTLIEYGGNEK